MDDYKLSIIIPCYANSNSVRENTIDLIGFLGVQAEQAKIKTQVIVVDDCSPYPPLPVSYEAHEYADLVMNLCQPNQGVSHSRNVGLDGARGEIVTFIDADDYVTDSYIQNVIDAMDGYGYATFPALTTSGGIIPFRDEFYGNYAVWAWAFRRSIIGYKRFDENMNVGEDIVWLKSLGLEQFTRNDWHIPSYIYNWGANPDSLSKRFNRGDLPRLKSDTNPEP